MEQDAGRDDWRRSPGRGAYAGAERERRFLVLRQPDPDQVGRLVEDRYVDGTTLRLRRVSAGAESVRKLTQKVRLDADDPAEVAITNTYLTEAEHELLSRLPARSLRKTRRTVLVEGTRFVVDEFHDLLSGLLLAEVEVASLDAPLPSPDWLGPEVTHDDRWSGGRLAELAAPEAAEVVLLAGGRPAEDVRAGRGGVRLVVGEGDAALDQRLSDELDAHNLPAAGAGEQRELTVRLEAEDGSLIAGLSGWTWGTSAGIAMVWVSPQARGEGYGARLLAAAEQVARDRGCLRVNVSSFTFQAPGFYAAHGYAEVGRTADLPLEGQADVHFVKSLT